MSDENFYDLAAIEKRIKDMDGDEFEAFYRGLKEETLCCIKEYENMEGFEDIINEKKTLLQKLESLYSSRHSMVINLMRERLLDNVTTTTQNPKPSVHE